jgi:hypothetical protein
VVLFLCCRLKEKQQINPRLSNGPRLQVRVSDESGGLGYLVATRGQEHSSETMKNDHSSR